MCTYTRLQKHPLDPPMVPSGDASSPLWFHDEYLTVLSSYTLRANNPTVWLHNVAVLVDVFREIMPLQNKTQKNNCPIWSFWKDFCGDFVGRLLGPQLWTTDDFVYGILGQGGSCYLPNFYVMILMPDIAWGILHAWFFFKQYWFFSNSIAFFKQHLRLENYEKTCFVLLFATKAQHLGSIIMECSIVVDAGYPVAGSANLVGVHQLPTWYVS